MQVMAQEVPLRDFDIHVSITYGKVFLDKRTKLRDSFRTVMANIISHMRNNISEAEGGEVEGIHQLRVGIRRARAALRLYEPMLPPNKVKRFEKRLRQYGLIFGAARDWDVFLQDTFDAAWPDAEKIRERATFQQRVHHEHVSGILKNPQFGNLLDRMTEWSQKVELPNEAIRDIAPQLLERMVSQTRKRQRKANKDDVKSLHRLRRSVKRLRYAAEFFGSLYPKKRVRRYTKVLKDAQDRLGHYNDAVVTEGLLFHIDMVNPVRGVLADLQRKTHNKVVRRIKGLEGKRFW